MKEIAIFGGTFDPPTRAHEALAAACLRQPGIDEVWLMPSGQRLDKRRMSTNLARIAMLRLVAHEAFADDQRLVISDFEQKQPQPTNTWRTSRALQAAYPEHNFWYVFGADAYRDMPRWQHGEQLQADLNILVVPRGHIAIPPETATTKRLAIDAGYDETSSTEVRSALQHGLETERQIRPSVAAYVLRNCLYREAALV